ncbi:PHP domain-containing protein [Candidatus Vidania fulgoroideorum]
MFNNLKLYSEFSLENGILKVEDILKKLNKDNQKYICITDKNNISSSVKTSILSKVYNIKSITGTEIYINDKKNSIFGNIIILVKNNEGFKNICSILNKVWKNFSKFGLHYIDLKYIKKKNKGLIFYSGGKNSYSSGIFYENNIKKLYTVCETVFNFIKKSNFLIEIQRYNKKSIIESEKLINLSYKKNIPLIVTNPIFFIKKKEKFIYETKICIKNKIKYKDLIKDDIKFHKFLSQKKANKVFKDIPNAILNTKLVSEKCIFNYIKKDRYPKFYKKINSFNELKKKIFKIIKKRKLEKNYINLVKYELNVIKKTKFSHFFLIVYDIVKWVKKNKIQVGPGRGSSASSLVAYLLNITEVDPVKNNLLFERFLNKSKNCMPDFDIDFSHKNRKLIIKYIQNKYGKNNVLNIVTFGKFAIKNSIKDSGRIFGISYNKINDLIKSKNIKKKKFYKASKGIEDRVRNIGIHAGGIIIYNNKINKLPFFYINKKGRKFVKVSQFDKYDIEYLGFLKLDILGLKTLTVIENIKKNSNFYKKFSELNIEDEKVFNLICKGQTNGIFQLESYGIKKLLLKVKPRNFNDLVSVLALYRPGTIFLIDKFCKRKNGAKISYINKKISKITSGTYGIIIFQEQIIKIITECYNININKAEEIRKYISKSSKNFTEIKKFFFNKIKEKYIDKENKIFNTIIKYSGYLFNKAHAVSYAMITYYMAYLKVYFYKNFILSNINNFISDKEKTNLFIEEAINKVYFIKPNINNSVYKFIKKKDNILFGFGGIKNLGKKASRYIIKERKKKKFKDFYDFYFRLDKSLVNKRKIESLIFSNVFTNNIHKKMSYLQFLKRKISHNTNQLRIFSTFIKVEKKKISTKQKLFFIKKEFYHMGTFLKCPLRLFKKEISKKLEYIKVYKYNYTYTGYVKKIFKTKNNSYFILLRNGNENKSFFVLKNICFKIKNMDIIIVIGKYINNNIFIKKIKKIE